MERLSLRPRRRPGAGGSGHPGAGAGGGHRREEAALLGQADYRQKLAVAEAKGILEYLGIPWVETEEETDYQAEARAAVDWLTENGIMQGNAEGDLMLDQPLTRRQFAVLEYRIAKLEGFV